METIKSGNYYHIYNRGNNRQDIFFENENYDYFLRLIKKHLKPVSEIFCYCLLPNHFHVLLKINDATVNPSQQFSNLFNAYTKAINKRYNRSGSLFQKPFKRIQIKDESYLKTLITYIHLNPEKHNIHDDFTNYKYSSYKSITSKLDTHLNKNEAIGWFEDIDNFIFAHTQRKVLINNVLEELTLE